MAAIPEEDLVEISPAEAARIYAEQNQIKPAGPETEELVEISPVKAAKLHYEQARANLKPGDKASQAAFKAAHANYYGKTSMFDRLGQAWDDFNLKQVGTGLKKYGEQLAEGVSEVGEQLGAGPSFATQRRIVQAQEAATAAREAVDAKLLADFKAAVASGDQAQILAAKAKFDAAGANAQEDATRAAAIRQAGRQDDAARGALAGLGQGALEAASIPATLFSKALETALPESAASAVALKRAEAEIAKDTVAGAAAGRENAAAQELGRAIGQAAGLPEAQIGQAATAVSDLARAPLARAVQTGGQALAKTSSAATDLGTIALAGTIPGANFVLVPAAKAAVLTSRRGALGASKYIRATAGSILQKSGSAASKVLGPEVTEAAKDVAGKLPMSKNVSAVTRIATSKAGELLARVKDRFGVVPATTDIIGGASKFEGTTAQRLADSAEAAVNAAYVRLDKLETQLNEQILKRFQEAGIAKPTPTMLAAMKDKFPETSVLMQNLRNAEADVKSVERGQAFINSLAGQRTAAAMDKARDALAAAVVGGAVSYGLTPDDENMFEAALAPGAFAGALAILGRGTRTKYKRDGTVELEPDPAATRKAAAEHMTKAADALDEVAKTLPDEPVPTAEPAAAAVETVPASVEPPVAEPTVASATPATPAAGALAEATVPAITRVPGKVRVKPGTWSSRQYMTPEQKAQLDKHVKSAALADL